MLASDTVWGPLYEKDKWRNNEINASNSSDNNKIASNIHLQDRLRKENIAKTCRNLDMRVLN